MFVASVVFLSFAQFVGTSTAKLGGEHENRLVKDTNRNNRANKLGLSCAKLRPASLLRFLLLENFELCKCAKLELGLGLSLAKSCLQVVNKS